MKNMQKKMFLIISVILILLISFSPEPVFAEDKGDFKDDGESHYNLDIVPDDADDVDYFENDGEQDRGFFGFLKVGEAFEEKVAEGVNLIANTGLKFNMFLTELMIAALDLAYEFNFVDILIDEIGDIMGDITGISSSGAFQDNGIFGQLAIFVAIFAVLYAVFMLVFKRSMFQSLGAILQTVICLTIAILLFTHYAPFLKGVNQVTTEMSSLVLGSSVSINGEDEESSDAPTGLDEDSLRNKMADNLWTLFVDRPYMYLVYGKTRLDDDLTEERVKSLLKTEVNSSERLNVLENEYDSGNRYILYSNATTRLSFTPIYLVINGITSVLVYGLALFLILFQFWFMMIAVFAPFALLIGAIPGMFGVTQRYFIELGLPLVLKIVVSFGALVVFSISEVLYEMDFRLGEMGSSLNSTFGFYMTVVAIHWVMFSLLFFLRKRISNIFFYSNRFMTEMREGLRTTTDPMKKGVQSLSTAAGTAVGAIAGGPAGAAVGASIGSQAGKMATGEGSVTDLAQTAGKAHMYSQFRNKAGNAGIGTKGGSDGGSNNGSSSNISNVGTEQVQHEHVTGLEGGNAQQQSNVKDQANQTFHGMTTESKDNINKFMTKQGFSRDSDKVASELGKAGITDVSEGNLAMAHNEVLRGQDGNSIPSNYSDQLISNLNKQQLSSFDHGRPSANTTQTGTASINSLPESKMTTTENMPTSTMQAGINPESPPAPTDAISSESMTGSTSISAESLSTGQTSEGSAMPMGTTLDGGSIPTSSAPSRKLTPTDSLPTGTIREGDTVPSGSTMAGAPPEINEITGSGISRGSHINTPPTSGSSIESPSSSEGLGGTTNQYDAPQTPSHHEQSLHGSDNGKVSPNKFEEDNE